LEFLATGLKVKEGRGREKTIWGGKKRNHYTIYLSGRNVTGKIFLPPGEGTSLHLELFETFTFETKEKNWRVDTWEERWMKK